MKFYGGYIQQQNQTCVFIASNNHDPFGIYIEKNINRVLNFSVVIVSWTLLARRITFLKNLILKGFI